MALLMVLILQIPTTNCSIPPFSCQGIKNTNFEASRPISELILFISNHSISLDILKETLYPTGLILNTLAYISGDHINWKAWKDKIPACFDGSVDMTTITDGCTSKA